MQSHPRSFWVDVVGEVERADALLDVARRHEVNPSTLRWRRSELRRHPISKPRFVPVVVSPPRESVPVIDPRGAPHLEVVARDIVVRVPLGTDVVTAAPTLSVKTVSFCIATDAKGHLVQPVRDGRKGHVPCRRGHDFVLVADRDHVPFEYTPKETSAYVRSLIHGYSGYVQADAKSVYDALFREPNPDDADDDPTRAVPREVGCWAHARRKFSLFLETRASDFTRRS